MCHNFNHMPFPKLLMDDSHNNGTLGMSFPTFGDFDWQNSSQMLAFFCRGEKIESLILMRTNTSHNVVDSTARLARNFVICLGAPLF